MNNENNQAPQPALTQPTTAAQPPVTTPSGKYKFPTAFKTSLVLFGMAASAVLAVMPSFVKGISTAPSPNFIIFLLAGVVGVAFTAFVFSRVSKLGLGFNRSVIVMAIGYNALIAVIKLALAPMALYLANQNQAFDTKVGGDPNTPFYYAVVGAIVLLLYIGVFRIIYGHFKKHFAANQAAASVTGQPAEKHKRAIGSPSFIVLIAVIGLVVAGGTGFVFVPLVAIGPALSYLGYVFSTVGIAVFAAVIAAIVMAYKSFDKVEKQATATGDATLLASFFWVGLSLILLYHVMWIVFMITLVTTWPFKTYTPK